MQHSEGFLNLVNEVRPQIKELSIEDVKQMLERKEHFVLIDVREESEWNRGHLPTAIHLSKGILERDIEERIQDKSKKIVLYCGGGYRSALALSNIQKMGYTDAYSMWGGYRVWCEKHYPLVAE